ncbi:hypothetical protein AAMO2058_001004100 [Amorphochlora amoebiformis]
MADEEYLKRLGTYSASVWFGKPPNLQPPFLARYGWSCASSSLLRCTCCHVAIYVDIDNRLSRPLCDRAAKIFEGKVRGSHKEHCIWKDNPCPESFEKLPTDYLQVAAEVADRAVTLSDIRPMTLPCLPAGLNKETGGGEGKEREGEGEGEGKSLDAKVDML